VIANTSFVALTAEDQGPTELLDQARSGDAESFGALCSLFQDRLVRHALALCKDEAQAQDLAQETLIAAWKSISRYKGQCHFATWLCSILLHKHKSLLRRSRWRRLVTAFTVEDKEFIQSVEDNSVSPDRAAQLSEQSRRVLSALNRLPPKQREIVFLRFYADESLEGIAAATNCSLGTVKSRLFHALENLRRMRITKEEFP
jgi:RNA polymerase sigma-70 factor (ECF subfamily)